MKPSQEHSDAVFYKLAMEEIQSGNLNRGLMAKAIAKSKGDKKGAEALYLEWRVKLLQEEAIAEQERIQAEEYSASLLSRRAEEKRKDEKRRQEHQEQNQGQAEEKQQQKLEYSKTNIRHSLILLFIFITSLCLLFWSLLTLED